MDWLADPQIWIALATLTALEIVLGIDNIIFISILAAKLPAGEQARARTMGLALAMITRILLLLSLAWMMRLTEPLFSLLGFAMSGRDLILLAGGLFLIGKSTFEIHEKLEGEEGHTLDPGRRELRRRHFPDPAARRRVLARLGDHRGRHGEGDPGHGRRARDRGGAGHDGRGRRRSPTSSSGTRRSRCWRSPSSC